MKIMKSVAVGVGSVGVLATALAVGTRGASPEPRPAPAAGARQGQFGTIKGRLVWGGDSAPDRTVLVKKGDGAAQDSKVCATETILARDLVVDPKTKGVRFAFAYLASPKGKNPDAEKALVEKAPKVVIDQQSCEFVPYATPIFQGQKLVFKSSDPVGHNVRYTPFNPANPAKNVNLPPKGELEVQLKAERRPMEINCDIHKWMKAYMMVFDHPFFAVTDEDGSFEIAGVPAGTQNLVVWQEKVGFVTKGAIRGMPVQVRAGEVTDVGDVVLDPAKVRK